MPPPRYNILIYVYDVHRYGGTERVVSRLSREWKKAHQVTIVVDNAQPAFYPMGGEIYDLKAPASRYLLMKLVRRIQRTGRLAHLIFQRKFTHLIGFGERHNFQLIIAALFVGALGRVTASVHNAPKDSASHSGWHIRAMIRVLYRLPRRIIAVSLGIKQQLIAMGIPRTKIDFIPNTAPVVASKPLTRPEIQADYILAVGRLRTQKGFDVLLHAYAGLVKAVVSAVPDLVIVGEGGERHALTKLAQSLAIDDRVHLVGATKNPEYYYAHAEFFVLSSRDEGWPLVILEAMSYGCAVISFDCPTGPREIITHGKNGLLVANGDVAGLTKAMAELLGDTKLRQRLGKAGQKRAGDFAIAKLAPMWLK